MNTARRESALASGLGVQNVRAVASEPFDAVSCTWDCGLPIHLARIWCAADTREGCIGCNDCWRMTERAGRYKASA